MKTRHIITWIASVSLFALAFLHGCQSDSATETSEKAKKVALDTAKEAVEKAESAVLEAKEVAETAVQNAGELSEQVIDSLKAKAEESREGVESIIVKGHQLVSTAAKIKKLVDQAVDSETVIEPVYQRIDDAEGMKRVDKAIGDMPRVEVINGLTVGFKNLSHSDTAKHESESGYLILWRQGDHLVGFVYRKKRKVEMDKLIKDIPQLIRLFGEGGE